MQFIHLVAFCSKYVAWNSHDKSELMNTRVA